LHWQLSPQVTPPNGPQLWPSTGQNDPDCGGVGGHTGCGHPSNVHPQLPFVHEHVLQSSLQVVAVTLVHPLGGAPQLPPSPLSPPSVCPPSVSSTNAFPPHAATRKSAAAATTIGPRVFMPSP
jgi:hypothetical protein